MKYAIVESGGKQYKAVEGGTLEVDRLPVQPGSQVKLEQVLLLADEGNIAIGTPLIRDNPVWTRVVEHFKGEKLTIFNYSPKKRIRVKTGHRQNYTRLLVEQIGGAELVAKEPASKTRATRKVEKPKAEIKAVAQEEKIARKPDVKPVEKKAEKPAKTTEKPVKTGAKKPAASTKKPAAKK